MDIILSKFFGPSPSTSRAPSEITAPEKPEKDPDFQLESSDFGGSETIHNSQENGDNGKEILSHCESGLAYESCGEDLDISRDSEYELCGSAITPLIESGIHIQIENETDETLTPRIESHLVTSLESLNLDNVIESPRYNDETETPRLEGPRTEIVLGETDFSESCSGVTQRELSSHCVDWLACDQGIRQEDGPRENFGGLPETLGNSADNTQNFVSRKCTENVDENVDDILDTVNELLNENLPQRLSSANELGKAPLAVFDDDVQSPSERSFEVATPDLELFCSSVINFAVEKLKAENQNGANSESQVSNANRVHETTDDQLETFVPNDEAERKLSSSELQSLEVTVASELTIEITPPAEELKTAKIDVGDDSIDESNIIENHVQTLVPTEEASWLVSSDELRPQNTTACISSEEPVVISAPVKLNDEDSTKYAQNEPTTNENHVETLSPKGEALWLVTSDEMRPHASVTVSEIPVELTAPLLKSVNDGKANTEQTLKKSVAANRSEIPVSTPAVSAKEDEAAAVGENLSSEPVRFDDDSINSTASARVDSNSPFETIALPESPCDFEESDTFDEEETLRYTELTDDLDTAIVQADSLGPAGVFASLFRDASPSKSRPRTPKSPYGSRNASPTKSRNSSPTKSGTTSPTKSARVSPLNREYSPSTESASAPSESSNKRNQQPKSPSADSNNNEKRVSHHGSSSNTSYEDSLENFEKAEIIQGHKNEEGRESDENIFSMDSLESEVSELPENSPLLVGLVLSLPPEDAIVKEIRSTDNVAPTIISGIDIDHTISADDFVGAIEGIGEQKEGDGNDTIELLDDIIERNCFEPIKKSAPTETTGTEVQEAMDDVMSEVRTDSDDGKSTPSDIAEDDDDTKTEEQLYASMFDLMRSNIASLHKQNAVGDMLTKLQKKTSPASPRGVNVPLNESDNRETTSIGTGNPDKIVKNLAQNSLDLTAKPVHGSVTNEAEPTFIIPNLPAQNCMPRSTDSQGLGLNTSELISYRHGQNSAGNVSDSDKNDGISDTSEPAVDLQELILTDQLLFPPHLIPDTPEMEGILNSVDVNERTSPETVSKKNAELRGILKNKSPVGWTGSNQQSIGSADLERRSPHLNQNGVNPNDQEVGDVWSDDDLNPNLDKMIECLEQRADEDPSLDLSDASFHSVLEKYCPSPEPMNMRRTPSIPELNEVNGTTDSVIAKPRNDVVCTPLEFELDQGRTNVFTSTPKVPCIEIPSDSEEIAPKELLAPRELSPDFLESRSKLQGKLQTMKEQVSPRGRQPEKTIMKNTRKGAKSPDRSVRFSGVSDRRSESSPAQSLSPSRPSPAANQKPSYTRPYLPPPVIGQKSKDALSDVLSEEHERRHIRSKSAPETDVPRSHDGRRSRFQPPNQNSLNGHSASVIDDVISVHHERRTPEIFLNLESQSNFLESTSKLSDRLTHLVQRLEDRHEHIRQPSQRRRFVDTSASSGVHSQSDMTDVDTRNLNLSRRYQDLVQRQLIKNNGSVEDLGLHRRHDVTDDVTDRSRGLAGSMPSLTDSSVSARKRFPPPRVSRGLSSPGKSAAKSRGGKSYLNGDSGGAPSSLTREQEGLETEVMQLTRELEKIKVENERLQRLVDDFRNKIPYNESETDPYGRLLAEKETLATEVFALREQLQESESRLNDARLNESRLESRLLSESRLNRADSNSSIGPFDPEQPNVLKRKITDLQSQIEDLQEAHESAVSKLGRAEQTIRQLERDRDQLEAVNGVSVEDLQAENTYLREQMDKLQEKRDNFYHDADTRLTSEIDGLRKDMRALRERNQQVNEENLRLREELRDIRSRSEDRERRLRNFYNNKLNDSNKYTDQNKYSDAKYDGNKYDDVSKYDDITPSKYTETSLVNGDKYGYVSSERLNRLEDSYGPLHSTQRDTYTSSKITDVYTSHDVTTSHCDDIDHVVSPGDGDLYYERSRRSRPRERMEPAYYPDCRQYRSNMELDKDELDAKSLNLSHGSGSTSYLDLPRRRTASNYYSSTADDRSRDRPRDDRRDVSRDVSRRPRSTSRGSRHRPTYDDDSDASSTSSILEEVERELGYLRSESRTRSRSLDSKGSRRRGRSVSPDPALTPVGYRSVSPAPLIKQHNKASLGYPSKKSQLSTSGKRPFAPRSPADVKQGDIVKFSRQNGKISKGLVKFIGHLPGRNDIYLGLELENEDGKHDGTYNGQRFFTCKHNKGVFVTFSKVVMVWG